MTKLDPNTGLDLSPGFQYTENCTWKVDYQYKLQAEIKKFDALYNNIDAAEQFCGFRFYYHSVEQLNRFFQS